MTGIMPLSVLLASYSCCYCDVNRQMGAFYIFTGAVLDAAAASGAQGSCIRSYRTAITALNHESTSAPPVHYPDSSGHLPIICCHTQIQKEECMNEAVARGYSAIWCLRAYLLSCLPYPGHAMNPFPRPLDAVRIRLMRGTDRRCSAHFDPSRRTCAAPWMLAPRLGGGLTAAHARAPSASSGRPFYGWLSSSWARWCHTDAGKPLAFRPCLRDFGRRPTSTARPAVGLVAATPVVLTG